MQHGDLSDQITPHLMLVFEGLIGVLPTKKAEGLFDRHVKHRHWAKALDQFEIHEPTAIRMWDINQRTPYSIDVVTWISKDFAKLLRGWLDEQDLPVARVTYQDPTTFPRRIAYMPNVAAIYSPPDPRHPYNPFGSKGRYIDLSPESLNQMGRF